MGLASIIAVEPDMTVCAEASTGEQAQALFRTHRPDVTLMDLRLPGMSGAETIQAIRQRVPRRAVRDALDLCLRRGDLRRAAGGRDGLPGEVGAARRADERRSGKRRPASGTSRAEVAARLADRVARSQLSAREIEVLRLLVSGRRNREIASSAGDHRRHGQAARQQHPGQARRRRSHRGRHDRPPARHRPAERLSPADMSFDISRPTPLQ